MTVETSSTSGRAPAGRSPEPECDLIMKGGITSGVAYPAAVGVLSEDYRFRGIGGASAGAIAAAVTAAAEYARQHGGDGFGRLAKVRDELQEPGLLPRLFTPSRQARPLLELFQAVQAKKSGVRKALRFLGFVGSRLLLSIAVFVLVVAVLLALLVRAADGTVSALGVDGWAIVAAFGIAAFMLALTMLALWWLFRLMRHLPKAQYGMCSGLAPAGQEPALTEWLHARIQRIAGLDVDRPLTFDDLDSAAQDSPGVQLRMMTTDLTVARPLRFPLPQDAGYLYEPATWAQLFPGELMSYLDGLDETCSPRVATADGRQLRELPSGKLPVLVATRMSLSFPILLAAVPVWMRDRAGTPVEHWISDGGISSNFPVHFFDSWVPRRPTFGLNLVPVSRADERPDRAEKRCDPAAAVYRYDNAQTPPLRRAPITSVPKFAGQILDTMQNWTDTAQAELPGFRDRIVHIELEDDEGGMNIAMPKETIKCVDAKGVEAGRSLRDFDFDRHWLARFSGAMRQLQRNLRGDDEAPRIPGLAAAFTDEREAWLRTRAAMAANGLPVDAAWCAAAADATRHLLDDAEAWLDTSPATSFTSSGQHHPPGVLRLTPDT